MKYKFHAAIMTAVLLVISLISCQPKAAKFKGTKIRLMQCCGETRDIPAVSSALLRIKKELKVLVDNEVSPSFNPYYESIASQAAIPEPVDVIYVTSNDFIRFYNDGLLADLTPFLQEDKEIDITDYHTGTADYFTREEKVFAVPRDINPLCAVYYNKRIFDEAGVAYPSDDWNLDTFLEISKKLVKSDSKGRVIQFGFLDESPYWKPWIYAFGGRLVNDIKDPAKCLIGSSEAVAGAQFRGDLINKYSIMPDYAQISENGASKDRSIMFLDGKTAMFFGPLEDSLRFRKIKSFDWDIVLFPTANTTTAKAYDATCSGYAIYSHSKNKEAAWELIKYLTDKKTEEELADAGYVPALSKVLSSNHFIDGSKPKNKGAVLKALPHLIYPPSHINWEEAEMSEIEPALDSVWKNTEPASVALGRIVRSIDKYYLKKK